VRCTCLGGVRVEVAGELLAFVVYRRAGMVCRPGEEEKRGAAIRVSQSLPYCFRSMLGGWVGIYSVWG